MEAEKRVAGVKQSRKAIREGRAVRVYLASDADPALTGSIAAECAAAGIPVETERTMAQLGRETREGYDPIPWYSNPRWSKLLMPVMPGIYNRWVLNIHVDGVDCRMGQIQFDLTDYEMNVYPVRIDYLPNSRLVLWISCGEE